MLIFSFFLHVEVILQVQPVIMRKKQNFLFFFFSCEKQKLKIKWRLNICKIHVSTEIANIHAHKVISDAYVLKPSLILVIWC
jgi:hypothetical protein